MQELEVCASTLDSLLQPHFVLNNGIFVIQVHCLWEVHRDAILARLLSNQKAVVVVTFALGVFPRPCIGALVSEDAHIASETKILVSLSLSILLAVKE